MRKITVTQLKVGDVVRKLGTNASYRYGAEVRLVTVGETTEIRVEYYSQGRCVVETLYVSNEALAVTHMGNKRQKDPFNGRVSFDNALEVDFLKHFPDRADEATRPYNAKQRRRLINALTPTKLYRDYERLFGMTRETSHLVAPYYQLDAGTKIHRQYLRLRSTFEAKAVVDVWDSYGLVPSEHEKPVLLRATLLKDFDFLRRYARHKAFSEGERK